MIEQRDVEQPTDLGQLPCDAQVFPARRRIAARMVVNGDDARRALANSFAEDFPRAHERGREGANVYDGCSEDRVLSVQKSHAEMLFLLVAKMPEEMGDALGPLDARLNAPVGFREPSPDFHPSETAPRLERIHALTSQLGGREVPHSEPGGAGSDQLARFLLGQLQVFLLAREA